MIQVTWEPKPGLAAQSGQEFSREKPAAAAANLPWEVTRRQCLQTVLSAARAALCPFLRINVR